MILRQMKGIALMILCLIIQKGYCQEGKEIVYARPNPTKEWKAYNTLTIDQLDGFKEKKTKLSKYGSLIGDRQTAIGFFYVKKIGDRWWAIDPEGNCHINLAINSVNPGKSERNVRAFENRFGNRENWMEKSALLFFKNGFNGIGGFSDVKSVKAYNVKNPSKPLVYTVKWSFMGAYARQKGRFSVSMPGVSGYPNNTTFLFDNEFGAFCDEYAKQLIEYKNDKNLFGHFCENELPLSLKDLDHFLISEKENKQGYDVTTKWLYDRNISRDKLNDAIRSDFMAYEAERYYSIVSSAIKKYDPNHLYLGSRFHGTQKHVEQFMRAAGKYVDLNCFNYYGQWGVLEKHINEWDTWTGKPFMITEFYTRGEDSGLGNTTGAGWNVKTQKDRGYFYQHYTLGLLKSQKCVGFHWFMYQDNDPTAKGVHWSNVDGNKGIVDNDFKPYSVLLKLMKELNLNVYNLTSYYDKVQKQNAEIY